MIQTGTSGSCSVKGSAIASRILWVRLHQGEQGLDRLQRQVSDGLAGMLQAGAVMAEWYPIDWFVELNIAIDRLFGEGDQALIKELGRHGADANLTTIYRLFFKVGTVKWILARAARLWGMHYNSGRLLVREFPGKEVELEIMGFGRPSRVHCLAVHGWAERAAELSGAQDVTVSEVDCRASGDARCRFRMTWR